MIPQQNPTAAQQIEQVTRSLTQALLQKEDAQAKLKEAETAIAALRNVLAGVQVGQQLQQEIDGANKPAAPPTP